MSAAPVVIYDGKNWETEYDIKILNGGLNGLFDLPTARDDGFHWIPGSNIPVSDGSDQNMRRIIINCIMEKSNGVGLLTELTTFTSTMHLIRKVGEFKTLKFWSSYTTSWEALPTNILVSFFGNTTNANKARITVIFDCITDFLDIP